MDREKLEMFLSNKNVVFIYEDIERYLSFLHANGFSVHKKRNVRTFFVVSLSDLESLMESVGESSTFLSFKRTNPRLYESAVNMIGAAVEKFGYKI